MGMLQERMLSASAKEGPAADALWRRRLELERHWDLREGTEGDFYSLRHRITAYLLTVGLKGLGLYERGRANACSLRLHEEAFYFPNLPDALEGFQILHLSDMHFPSNDPRFFEAVRRLLAGHTTDLCLLTGDYRFGHYGSQENVHETVAQILAGIQARLGFYAVLGNHDLSDIVAPMQGIGIQMLINEGLALHVGDAALWLAGVDDPHKFKTHDVEAAFAGCPEDAFRIFLAHSPELIPEAAAHAAQIYLCGHTHGGQLRLPWWGAIHLNARCKSAQALGRWRYGALQGYTTYGLGTTDIPVRYNCPGEAVRITLRRRVETG